jgi:hypothetical protein
MVVVVADQATQCHEARRLQQGTRRVVDWFGGLEDWILGIVFFYNIRSKKARVLLVAFSSAED